MSAADAVVESSVVDDVTVSFVTTVLIAVDAEVVDDDGAVPFVAIGVGAIETGPPSGVGGKDNGGVGDGVCGAGVGGAVGGNGVGLGAIVVVVVVGVEGMGVGAFVGGRGVGAGVGGPGVGAGVKVGTAVQLESGNRSRLKLLRGKPQSNRRSRVVLTGLPHGTALAGSPIVPTLAMRSSSRTCQK